MSYVDPTGLKIAFGDKRSERLLRPVLEYLERSPAGAKLIQQLDRSKTVFTLYDSNKLPGVGGANPPKNGSNGEVRVNSNNGIYINTKSGLQAATIARILAHELGHLTGVEDDGFLNMNNVNAHENAIMSPLDGLTRTGY